MAVNAFISFFDKADGESIQKGKEKWVEIQGWDWEVEAETSWTKGGGASVGKPNPGKLNFEHYFDTSSTVILGYICTGKAFPKVQLQMMKTTGKGSPETYFTMTMEGAFITKVSNSGRKKATSCRRSRWSSRPSRSNTSRRTTRPARSAPPRPTTGTSRQARRRRRPDPSRGGDGAPSMGRERCSPPGVA